MLKDGTTRKSEASLEIEVERRERSQLHSMPVTLRLWIAEESSYLCVSCFFLFVRSFDVRVYFILPPLGSLCVTTPAVYITPEWQLKENEKRKEAFKKNHTRNSWIARSTLYFSFLKKEIKSKARGLNAAGRRSDTTRTILPETSSSSSSSGLTVCLSWSI